MATKIETLFIDDLDGSPANGTVRFALDGTSYEIDLSGEHAQVLREASSRFTGAARRAPGTRSPAGTRRKPGPGDLDSTEICDWARSQGITSRTAAGYPPSSSSSSKPRPRDKTTFRRPHRKHPRPHPITPHRQIVALRDCGRGDERSERLRRISWRPWPGCRMRAEGPVLHIPAPHRPIRDM